MTKLNYTHEIRERAVQLLIESEKDYPSNWAAITAIASKIGCTPETLHVWYQKYLAILDGLIGVHDCIINDFIKKHNIKKSGNH